MWNQHISECRLFVIASELIHRGEYEKAARVLKRSA